MLGPEPWRVTSGPNMCQVQVLTSKGCQWHTKAHNGPTPGKTAAIEVQHSGCGLLPQEDSCNSCTILRDAAVLSLATDDTQREGVLSE